MKNFSATKLFWNLLIAFEIFVTVALTTFLVSVVVLVNSVTNALGDFASAAIHPFG